MRRTIEGVEVEVVDTGAGIRPEDLPYVFDRFYHGEKSRSRTTGGAGLGLAIAQGIVEAHGGSIRVESEVGHGALFVFVLPSEERRMSALHSAILTRHFSPESPDR